MPKKLDPELKARAMRLVMEHRSEHPTRTAAVLAVVKQTGVGKESLPPGPENLGRFSPDPPIDLVTVR